MTTAAMIAAWWLAFPPADITAAHQEATYEEASRWNLGQWNEWRVNHPRWFSTEDERVATEEAQ